MQKSMISNYEARQTLKKAYQLLEPFSRTQSWEFNNELHHLKFVVNNFSKDTKILDAGCGIGLLAVSLSLFGYKVTGYDKYVFQENSPEDINNLKKLWSSVGLKIEPVDILEKNNLNEQFDLVVSVAVLEHQKYPKHFLESLLALTKKGGLMYIATPNVSNGLNRFRMFLGRAPMGNILTFFEEGKVFYGHWREYTLFELKKMCGMLGVEIVKAENKQAGLPPPSFKKIRTFHRTIFSLINRLIPGWGDTNQILVKKLK